MGIKNKHTLKVVFCQFAISLIIALAAAIILPFGLETLAINIGLATRANQSELQVKELMPVLTIAPDITKVIIPQECGYLILDKEFKELFSNMDEKEKADALLYAKGEYIGYGSGKQFVLVVRENEYCVLRYYVGSQFTIAWLPENFISPDMLTVILMIINSLAVIIFITAKFAKNLRVQLKPIFEATTEVAEQNLDFEIGHSKIKEFEDILLSFGNMKKKLKVSLEQQWKTEQVQKEQIAALAHDLKTPLTIIQGNAELICEADPNAEQSLYAKYILKSSKQMQTYIKTLIDISKAVIGYKFHEENINLIDYFEKIKVQINALCLSRKIQLVMEVSEVPELFKGDGPLLERAIMNVINNALDYSPRNGTIFVYVKKEMELVISVIDEGKGFSKEALHHAKEQFYIADQSRGSKMHFGMGLYITSFIVQQHGGSLHLDNDEITHGAKVIIKIPC